MTEKIMVIDDISSNLKLMHAILNKAEYQVITAESGEAAITLAREERPDLILLDIMMPGMNGYEVCQQLKQQEETSHIPVIFLSARSEKNSVVKGLETGGQDYITKPFHAQEFLLRVRIHLELKEKSEQLALLNQTLEEKVEEKTHQLLEANQRLEKLDVAKNNFLDLIAHELRTPLNGIMGISEILKASAPSAQQLTYLSKLQESAERLGRFSEMALLITTIASDENPMEKAPINLARAWKEARQFMTPRTAEKSLTIKDNFPFIGCPLMGNFDLLKEVFIILLRNGIKYSPEKGTLRLTVTQEDENTQLILEDQGPGFSPQAQEHLFTFFSTEDITHHQSGLGLGLALAKMIIDAHAGTLFAENITPQGARITITLPSAAP